MSGPITYASEGITIVFYPVSGTATTPTTTIQATSTVLPVSDADGDDAGGETETITSNDQTTTITANKVVTTTDSRGATITSTVSRTRTSIIANEHVASTDQDPGGTYTTSVWTTTVRNDTGTWTQTITDVEPVSATSTSTTTVGTVTSAGSSSNSTIATGSAAADGDAQLGFAAKVTIGVCATTLMLALVGLVFWLRRRRIRRRARSQEIREKQQGRGYDEGEKIPRGGGRRDLRIDTDVDRSGSNRGQSLTRGDFVEELRDPFGEGIDESDSESMQPVSATGTHRNNGSLPPSRSGTRNSSSPRDTRSSGGAGAGSRSVGGTVISRGGGGGTMRTVTSPEGMISPFPAPVIVPTVRALGVGSVASIGAQHNGGFLAPMHASASARQGRRISETTLDTGLDSLTDTDDDVYAVDGSSLARTLTTESLRSRDSRSTISARAAAAWGPFADSHVVHSGPGVGGRADRIVSASAGSVARYSEVDDDESIMARSGDVHGQPGWATFEPMTRRLAGSSSASSSSQPTAMTSWSAGSPANTSSTTPTDPTLGTYRVAPPGRPLLPYSQFAAGSSSMAEDPFADGQSMTYSTLPPPGRPHSIGARSVRSNSTNALTEASFRPGDDSRDGALPLHARWRTGAVPERPSAAARIIPRWQELERTETRSSLASNDTADTDMRSRETFVRHGDATMHGTASFGAVAAGLNLDPFATIVVEADDGIGSGQGGKNRIVHLPPTYREVYGDDF